MGANLGMHTLSPLDLAPAVVLQALASGPESLALGYNLRLWLSFVLAGWAMFRLARRWLRPSGAFLAGLVFTFSTYHVWVAPRLHLVTLEVLPLILLALLRFCDRPTWKRSLVLALLAAAAFYETPDYFVYSALIGIVVLVYRLATGAFSRRFVVQSGLTVLVFSVAILPVLLPRIEMALHAPLIRAVAEMKHYSLYPLDLVWPDRFSALYRGLFHRLPGTEVLAGTGYSPFLGFVPLVGLLIFAGSVRRLRWTWLLLLGGAVVLAAGPSVLIGGREIPLPYAGLMEVVPVLKTSRTPIRLLVVVLLAAGLITGAAWDRLRLRATTPRRPGFWILVGVALLIVAEHLHAPFVLEPVWMRQPFVRLGQEARSRPGAVLNLGIAMINVDHLGQIQHGQPLVLGNIPRAGHQLHAHVLERHPVLFSWINLRPAADRFADYEKQRQAVETLLAELGVRYVTVLRPRPDFMPEVTPETVDRVVAEVASTGFTVLEDRDGVVLLQRSP